jgi:hypothetical protein
MPQANETGLFEIDGKKYSTVVGWSKILKISQNAIDRRLANSQQQGIKGKDRTGRILNFYSESAIRQICADLLAKKSNS